MSSVSLRIVSFLLVPSLALISLFAASSVSAASAQGKGVSRLSGISGPALRKPLRMNPAKVRSDDPNWQEAQREIYIHQSDLVGRAKKVTAQSSRFLMRRGTRSRKLLALTFDDGPHPAYTRRLLEVLKKEKVKATFFVIGFMSEKNPDLIREISQEGHDIANHSYSHVNLTKIPFTQMMTEYKAANQVIRGLTGKSPKYCRPPGGDFSEAVVDAGAVLGMTTVLWTNDPGDYSNPGQKTLLQREVRKLTSGGIVLLHDGSQDTVDTLATFIGAAKRAGYRFVSLDELRGSKSKGAIKAKAPSLHSPPQGIKSS